MARSAAKTARAMTTMPVELATTLVDDDDPMLHTEIGTMSPKGPSLQHLTRPFLHDLHAWWLQGVPASYEAAPSQDVFKRWFFRDAGFDTQCRDRYKSAVLEAETLDVDQLESIVSEPKEAVALVVLLDQIPRNIFRGVEARRAYNVFDPKAVKLAQLFLGDKYAYGARKHAASFYDNYFLYMPLMHSEDTTVHEVFAGLLRRRREECQTKEEIEAWGLLDEFETKHYDVLKKYGRYPSRNEALGRTSSAEEEKYLADGGGFGGKA